MGKGIPTLTNNTYITKILPQNCPKTFRFDLNRDLRKFEVTSSIFSYFNFRYEHFIEQSKTPCIIIQGGGS